MIRFARLALVFVLCCGVAGRASAQSYTVTPTPFQTALDNSGHVINNACVWTYTAGTTTAATTYLDNAGTQNSNPIRSDPAGRFTAYLVVGQSYKFVYESSCTPPAHGTVLRTADNIAAVPASASNVDIIGTAGETLSAGLAVYLSAGDGGKTPGLWYKADSANSYSSWDAVAVGVVPATITSGLAGTIRLAGYVTGLTSLTVGSNYWVGAAGALTATMPTTTNPRLLGNADTTTSLIVVANPRALPPGDQTCGRLTLTSLVPVTTADVSSASTIYYSPKECNLISLFDGVRWPARPFSEISVAVPAVANTNYDVFVYDNAGTPTLEVSSAWFSTTAVYSAGIYATTRPLQDGRYVKSTNGTAIDATRRYVGSFRTEAAGFTDDTGRQRFVFNMYHRVPRSLIRLETVTSWTYTTATWRQAAGNPYNQVEMIAGVSEEPVDLHLYATADNGAGVLGSVTISVDTTTALSTQPTAVATISTTGSALFGRYSAVPGLGYHYFPWLEISAASSTTRWYAGGFAVSTGMAARSGLSGTVRQ